MSNPQNDRAQAQTGEIDTRARFIELARSFRSGMLVTHDGQEMHARPMWIAEVDDNGDVFFVTSMASPKATEIETDPRVSLVLQESSRYVAARGEARVIKDRSLVERLWREEWRVWFPQGKDQEDLGFIAIELRDAEYWDNSGVQGVKYVMSAAKAYAEGARPRLDKEQHAKTPV